MNVLPSRRERRRERTLNAILDAAGGHFLDHGYEDAKVDAIAAGADVAVGSIYNYFGSKDGLYAAVLERAVDLFELYLGDEAPVELSPFEQVLDTAGRLARFAREHPGQMRLLCLPQSSPAHAELSGTLARVADAMATHERRTAALLEASIRQGAARAIDARATAAFLWAAWKGALTLGPRAERAGPGRDSELQALLEAGLRVIVGGLASDAARERDGTVRTILDSAPGRGRLSLRRAAAAAGLRERFPELALWTAEVAVPRKPRPTTGSVRLDARARLTGAAAIGTQAASSPWGYKVFVRRVGMDPDAVRGDVERLALRGTLPQEYEERGLPHDALVIAAAETGVAIAAFDADRLEHDLWLREAREREGVAGSGEPVVAGTPVLADDRGPVAVPFGPRDPAVAVSDSTQRIVLAALQVKGIPDVSVEQALWTAIEIIRSDA